ncbi:hypothetical protein PAPYR_1251 [Paratrimastix pyriformis]|uniref:Centrosomal protein of 19 kDa n=1 Tax=Paratrimastix pyriformis TaxID=342808 RepID=A0ABQ8UXH0_9EUKA|nr:hypothetical protein PAPYR_1251 [Paratrimastix pyriformis]
MQQPADDFLPKQLGLKYSPPAIILEYEVPSTKKLRRRFMPVRELSEYSDAEVVAQALVEHHTPYLDPKFIKFEQIVSLVSQLQEHLGTPVSPSLPSIKKSPAAQTAPTPSASAEKPKEPAPAAAASESLRKPAFSSLAPIARQSTPPPPASSPLEMPTSPMGDMGDAGSPMSSPTPEKDRAPTGSISSLAGAPALGGGKPKSSALSPRSPPSSGGDEERGEASPISGTLDLNRVPDHENRAYKARMEKDFLRNQVKPGDPGFQYDVQVDFSKDGGKERSDWDEDEDAESPSAPPAKPRQSSLPPAGSIGGSKAPAPSGGLGRLPPLGSPASPQSPPPADREDRLPPLGSPPLDQSRPGHEGDTGTPLEEEASFAPAGGRRLDVGSIPTTTGSAASRAGRAGDLSALEGLGDSPLDTPPPSRPAASRFGSSALGGRSLDGEEEALATPQKGNSLDAPPSGGAPLEAPLEPLDTLGMDDDFVDDDAGFETGKKPGGLEEDLEQENF